MQKTNYKTYIRCCLACVDEGVFGGHGDCACVTQLDRFAAGGEDSKRGQDRRDDQAAITTEPRLVSVILSLYERIDLFQR